MPEPVGSQSVTSTYYDADAGVCVEPRPAPGASDIAPAKSPPVASGLDGDPASEQLVRSLEACADKKTALAQSLVAVVGSAAAVAAATPTAIGVLPSLATFVVSAMAVGKAAAELENCQELQERRNVGSGI